LWSGTYHFLAVVGALQLVACAQTFHAADASLLVWLDVFHWFREVVATALVTWHTVAVLIDVFTGDTATVVDNLVLAGGVKVVLAVGVADLDGFLVTDACLWA